MKHRERKPKPDVETLKADFERLSKSKAKLAHEYGVSPQTAHRWLRENDLVPALPSDAQDENRLERWKEKPQQEPVIIEGEVLMPGADAQIAPQEPSDSEPAALARSSAPPAPQDQDDEPETAFKQCSQSQKKALMILTDQPNITGRELAALTGVSEQSIITWKQSPLFQQALKELLVPAFKTEALLLVVSDLKRVIASQKARPEDRKLLAEISGLINGETTVVNVGIDCSDYLGRRFR